MAEFRKVFYALGFAAMLAGVSSTASAQQSTTCTQIATPAPIIRTESFSELVGDFALDCQGGNPTPINQAVDRVNITVSLSTNITSKILATGTAGNYSEALLIVDDPNSVNHPNTPLLACGQVGAPDPLALGSIRGVCGIISTGNPDQTYNGLGSVQTVGGAQVACDGSVATGVINCGHPNVFQGRQGVAQVSGNTNSIVFVVPFDPPGLAVADNPATPDVNEFRSGHRVLRITNIRANSPPVAGGFLFQTVIMEVNINANNLSVTNTTRTVASVNNGLLGGPIVNGNNLAQSFVQCQARTANSTQTLSVRFREGFTTSFKPKGLEQILGNSVLSGGSRVYNNTANYPAGVNQNVPGIVYNSESGFVANPNYGTPNPNPPAGYNSGVTGQPASTISNSTGVAAAGIATQGTRIAVTFRDIPNGTTVSALQYAYLYPAGVTPATVGSCSGVCTGIAIRTAYVSARGDGPFASQFTTNLFVPVTGDMIVYEVLYSDTSTIEDLFIPLQETHSLASLASDLPEVNKTAAVAGGFAPFILATDSANTWGSAQQASDTVQNVFGTNLLPVPRFRPGSGFQNLFSIQKCACNLLFPFVTNAASTNGNYDTGIALANTSLTPGGPASLFAFNPANGFKTGTAQDGPVQFWYYQSNLSDPPVATQCTNTTATGVCPGTTSVKAGETLLYILSQDSARWGLKKAAGFTGYMIAQANFQYCHAFAFISPQGATPLTNGLSVGYLALQLDGNSSLNPRTNQAAEGLVF